MKKFLIPIVVVILVIVIIMVYHSKKAEINSESVPNVEVKTPEFEESSKLELIDSFKRYRESIYKIKQNDIVLSLEKKASKNELLPSTCIKMAYDVQAFVMRSRLSKKSIENIECQKMFKIYQELAASVRVPKIIKPSFQKRLEKDVSYFTDELNKQEWRKEDLVSKKKEFEQKTKNNLSKLKKKMSPRREIKAPVSKCMNTLLMHQKEFNSICRPLLK